MGTSAMDTRLSGVLTRKPWLRVCLLSLACILLFLPHATMLDAKADAGSDGVVAESLDKLHEEADTADKHAGAKAPPKHSVEAVLTQTRTKSKRHHIIVHHHAPMHRHVIVHHYGGRRHFGYYSRRRYYSTVHISGRTGGIIGGVVGGIIFLCCCVACFAFFCTTWFGRYSYEQWYDDDYVVVDGAYGGHTEVYEVYDSSSSDDDVVVHHVYH